MSRFLIGLGTALLIIPGVALANPPDGFYGGVALGYNVGSGTLDIPGYAPSNEYGLDPDGIGMGAFAGYNFPGTGGMIFGVELGGNFLNTSDTVSTFVPGETFTVEGEWEASVVARVGGMAGDLFIYGLGGASIIEVSGAYSGGFPSQSDSQLGWTVGLGMERETAKGGFLRGEVRYADYPTFDLQCTACGPSNYDLSNISVSVGVGFEF
jgi:outer membrane immunogenic protein